jgi:Flp pilus assembly protein CpaB
VSQSTLLAVRARRLLARPVARRLAVAALAVATGVTVTSIVTAAEAARRSWGSARPVAVATRDLAPGDVVGTGAVEVRRLPAAAVADRALSEAPVGATVRQPVAAGEPLIGERLAPHGLTGAAALVPDGSRALAVPLGTVGTPPLTAGDLVDLLAVVPPEAGGDGGGDPAFPLVEGAQVVDVGDEVASVAVPTEDAPRVAYALSQGVVVLALTGR